MPINTEPEIHKNIICANIFIKRDNRYLLLRRSSQKKWLPNILHPIGGKVEINENPYVAAQREVFEEAGIKVKNMKLEAVILEITPIKDDSTNWLIFHFSADYDSGEIKQTEEGVLEWHTSDEIKNEKLFLSFEAVIDHILNPNDGTVFATIEYNEDKTAIINKNINLCVI